MTSTSTGRLGDHTVGRVGYGAMQLEKLHDDRPAAIALLEHALAHGVDHFDTAEFYGDGFVNGLLRETAARSSEAVVVTKVGAAPNPGGPIPLRPAQRPDEIRDAVEANLRSLGVDRLDVVNLRRLDVGPGISAEGDQVVDVDDQLEVLVGLRDSGAIGAIGLSSITADTLRHALPAGIVCVQNSYSLISREAEDLLDVCTANDIAWVPFFPLGSGFLQVPKVVDRPEVITGAQELGLTPSQVGLAWLLQHSPTTLLIPGTATVAHLDENLAVADVVLPTALVEALDGIAGSAAAAT